LRKESRSRSVFLRAQVKKQDLLSVEHTPVADALDEYLVQFRNLDGSLLRPMTRPARPPVASPGPRPLLRRIAPSPVRRGYRAARGLTHPHPGRGRVLPDFMVIGAAKCGTTSLFDWICEHPLVVRPTTDGQPRKELLYFDYFWYEDVNWYRTHFPRERDRRAFERQHGRPFLTGEATATYLTHYWAPMRVAKLLPNVKLIVTLRNPVDRAYSAFHMSRRERLEPCDSFEGALALESHRLASEEARVRADPTYTPSPPAPLGYWSYLQRSRYAQHVERWLEFFPSEQFLFLEFEQLAAQPRATLDRVYDFLAIPAHRHEYFRKLNAGEYSSMRPETRAQLVEYFRPHNERLRQLAGIDFGWDR
jgi:hypothetical protein